jgi:DNA-directed RNA polymerase specialized sigma24 family protein
MKDFDGFEFDQDFIQKLRTGDKDAETYFVAYFGALLHIRLRRFVSSGQIDSVRDQILSRVLAAIRSETGLDYAGHLTAFVGKICYEVQRELHGPQTSSSSPLGRFIAKLSEANGKENVRARDVVRQVLQELSPKERQMLRAVLIDHRSAEEVCKSLNLSTESLRILLFRVKRKFLLRYKQEGPDGTA